jgi:hypothetical protein
MVVEGDEGAALTWSLDSGSFSRLLPAVALSSLARFPGFLDVGFGDVEETAGHGVSRTEQTAVTTVWVRDVRGHGMTFALTPEVSTGYAVGQRCAVAVAVETELAALFILEALRVRVSVDGSWSHSVEIANEDGAILTSEGLRSVADLVTWFQEAAQGATS